MTEHIILIITVLIIMIFALRGWRKGFLGLIYGVFTWIFILIFMQIAVPIIEEQLTASSVYTGIYERVERAVRDRINERLPGIDLNDYAGMERSDGGRLTVEANGAVQTAASIDDIKNAIESETGISLEDAGEAIEGADLSGIGDILGDVSGLLGGILSGGGSDGASQSEDGTDGSTGGIGSGLSGLGIIGELSQLIEQAQQGVEAEVAAQLNRVIASIAEEVTARIIHIVAIVLAIILAIVICQFIRIILEWLHDLPVLGTLGTMLGLGWGIIEGFLVVWVLFAVFALLGGTDGSVSVFSEINENGFLLWLYQHNPILSVLSSIGWLSV